MALGVLLADLNRILKEFPFLKSVLYLSSYGALMIFVSSRDNFYVASYRWPFFFVENSLDSSRERQISSIFFF